MGVCSAQRINYTGKQHNVVRHETGAIMGAMDVVSKMRYWEEGSPEARSADRLHKLENKIASVIIKRR